MKRRRKRKKHTNRLHTYQHDIRQQADKESAELGQNRINDREEEHYHLLLNGGFLPTELLDDVATPWNHVTVMDPHDRGPPTRTRAPPRLALGDTNPDVRQVPIHIHVKSRH